MPATCTPRTHCMQTAFRLHAGCMQVAFNLNSGYMHAACTLHATCVCTLHAGCMQIACKKCMQAACRLDAMDVCNICMQDACTLHAMYICRLYAGCLQVACTICMQGACRLNPMQSFQVMCISEWATERTALHVPASQQSRCACRACRTGCPKGRPGIPRYQGGGACCGALVKILHSRRRPSTFRPLRHKM